MRRSIPLLLLLRSLLHGAENQPDKGAAPENPKSVELSIIERGPSHRDVEWLSYSTNEFGKVDTSTNH